MSPGTSIAIAALCCRAGKSRGSWRCSSRWRPARRSDIRTVNARGHAARPSCRCRCRTLPALRRSRRPPGAPAADPLDPREAHAQNEAWYAAGVDDAADREGLPDLVRGFVERGGHECRRGGRDMAPTLRGPPAMPAPHTGDATAAGARTSRDLQEGSPRAFDLAALIFASLASTSSRGILSAEPHRACSIGRISSKA